MDRRARLKAEVFEQLQVVKAAWRTQIFDLAQLNSKELEEVLDADDSFEDLFLEDEELREWDEEDTSLNLITLLH